MLNKKILWLCSWYPSKLETFNGDFIQRHAKAAALYNDIYVIHITNDFADKTNGEIQEIRTEGNLTEQIIYYKKHKSLVSKLTNQLSWLALYKKIIRSYIIKNGKPDLIHVHIPMKAGLLGLWIKKNYKIPYLLTEHWGVYNSVVEDGYDGKNYSFKKLTERIFNNAAIFISVSKYLAEGVNKLVCKKEFRVIPNTVDTNLFFYTGLTENRFRFVHVSNMVALKNPEGILRSFKMLLAKNENAELIMIGDYNQSLIEYTASLGLSSDQCQFRGEIPYAEVANEMQKANCLILFSTIENSPCVIGEALCCGLPVIATNVGGIPEMVNETNAILVPTKDEEAFKEAMYLMVSKRSQFDSKKIAESAKEKFSYSVIGKEIDAIYNEVLDEL